jgi:dihydroorotate dehydrogenase electron transfer subunit
MTTASAARPPRPHRETIFAEDAEVLAHEAYDGRQFVLRLKAPECARRATPGSFVHLQCDRSLPMRRPLSIMRADPKRGSIDVLYKIVGAGLELLSAKKVGERLSTLGPIGNGFVAHRERPLTLLIGGGVGIPPMIFLAEALRERADEGFRPLVLMGSEIPFPFRTKPSTVLIPGIPDGVIACMPLLDEWGIASRLASLSGFAGCHEGYVTELASIWLDALSAEALAQVEIFACGPTPMLKAVAQVAARFNVQAQVSLEEFMACAVGGCAGCAVKVQTPQGPAMKRVCVDGPVFDSKAVFTA